MDFNFLLRGIFTALVGVVCYYLIEVYKELKVVRKRLEKIEKHLEGTNEAKTEVVGLSFSDGTRFDIHFKDFSASKIHIVKEVRAITGLGLRETKELVESAPVIIQKRVSYTEAENAKNAIRNFRCCCGNCPNTTRVDKKPDISEVIKITLHKICLNLMHVQRADGEMDVTVSEHRLNSSLNSNTLKQTRLN